MSAARVCRWNGVDVDRVPAEARGLHYGDGVFRTLLQRDGEIVALGRQLDALIDELGISIEPVTRKH